jgi:hypothetical protein
VEPHSTAMRVQADILDGGPDDGEATGLRSTTRQSDRCVDAHCSARLGVRIGRLNVAVQGGRKGIKGQEVIFILRQAADCLPDSVACIWRFSAAS